MNIDKMKKLRESYLNKSRPITELKEEQEGQEDVIDVEANEEQIEPKNLKDKITKSIIQLLKKKGPPKMDRT